MTGRIVQVSGSVINVEFDEGQMPRINEALTVDLNGKTLVMEVAQHIGNNTVKCIMLSGSEGMSSGMEVTATGDSIRVPVGDRVLGRMFNVLGEPIDDGEPIPEDTERMSIHRKAPGRPLKYLRRESRSSTFSSLTRRAERSASSAAPE